MSAKEKTSNKNAPKEEADLSETAKSQANSKQTNQNSKNVSAKGGQPKKAKPKAKRLSTHTVDNVPATEASQQFESPNSEQPKKRQTRGKKREIAALPSTPQTELAKSSSRKDSPVLDSSDPNSVGSLSIGPATTSHTIIPNAQPIAGIRPTKVHQAESVIPPPAVASPPLVELKTKVASEITVEISDKKSGSKKLKQRETKETAKPKSQRARAGQQVNPIPSSVTISTTQTSPLETQPSAPQLLKLGNNAGLFRRSFAFILDLATLFIINLAVVGYELSTIAYRFVYPENGLIRDFILPPEEAYRIPTTALALFVINWFYFVICECSPIRQTLGMFICNISTQSWRNKRVSFIQSNFRLLGRIVSLCTIGLGFFSLLLDRRKLALQDKVSRTRVIVGR